MTLEMFAVIALVFVGVFAIGVKFGSARERRAIETLNKVTTDYSGAM